MGFIILDMNPPAPASKGIFISPVKAEKYAMSKSISTCVIALLAVALFLYAGCAVQLSSGNITDNLGRKIDIAAKPQRIISLAPSNTEILFALGLGDKVVGVTEYCNYPEEARTRAKVGGFSNVDIEKVVSLQPDLILATRIHSKTVIPALENLGLTVVALAPTSLDEILNSISLVGDITGQSRQASQLIASLKSRTEAVATKTGKLAQDQKARILYVTWHDPLMTAGKDTTVDDVIARAGGQNIAYDISGDKTIDLETVIARNPQVIVASVGMGTGKDLPWQYVNTEPRLKKTEALLKGRVYKIDGDIIHRPGPRVVEALEQMAKYIHPELFK